LWVRHGCFLLVLALATNVLQLAGITTRLVYFSLWFPLLSLWALIFWRMRQTLGPITFVERQMVHVWAGNVAAIGLTFVVELFLGLPTLTLAPTIAISSGSTFLAKAGFLTGDFYWQTAALYLTSLLMLAFPQAAMAIFGVVSALCFIVPGRKYGRQRKA
jgi:hypothetical protein